MRPTLEIEGPTIGVLGNFNPRIFHPTWFAENKLLREDEANVAIEGPTEFVVSPDLAFFKAGWLDLQVVQDRLLAHSSDPAAYVSLRDLVVGMFRLLEHTPLTQLGINHHFHYRMPSREEWDNFGHFLLPKGPWTGLVETPGMMVVGVTGPMPGRREVKLSIRVEPSKRVTTGVFVDINEHHEAVRGENPAKGLMSMLETNWHPAQDHAKKVAEQLFDSFYDGQN